MSREHLDGARLSVAVAVAWSPFSERRFDDLKAGRLVPSPNWKGELRAYENKIQLFKLNVPIVLSYTYPVRIYVSSEHG